LKVSLLNSCTTHGWPGGRGTIGSAVVTLVEPTGLPVVSAA